MRSSGTFRRLVALFVLAALTTVVALGESEPAFAVTAAGSDYQFVLGNSNLYTSQTWDKSVRQMDVYVHVSTALVSGYCVDSWFDWNFGLEDGQHVHYDSRGARDCQSNTIETSGTFTEASSTWPADAARGMNKAGGAWGPDNATTITAVYDAPDSQGSIDTINPTLNHSTFCSAYWKRNSNGTLDTWSGGSPRSCTS
jgi:hypothetical protein